MCILGKDKMIELIENYKVIYPYDYHLLDGDGYVLTVKEETTLHYLEHKTSFLMRSCSRLRDFPRIMTSN